MADDTRQSSPSPPSVPPSTIPSVLDPTTTTPPQPRAPANTMPGGTYHTAGGRDPSNDAAQTPSYIDVVRSLPKDYYLNFHKRPCVRDSQLTGIAAGFVGGGLAGVLGRNALISSNYAVASWAMASCIHYQVCKHYRRVERDGMRQAREIMDAKRAGVAAKQAQRRREREERDRLEAERREEERRRSSWGYWAERNLKFW